MATSFNGSKQLHSFLRGMNLDLDQGSMQEGMYSYAENIRLSVSKSGTAAVITAIKGFKNMTNDRLEYTYYDNNLLKSDRFTIDKYDIIGISTIRDVVVIFTVSPDKENSIFRLTIESDIVNMHRIVKAPFNINNGSDSDLSIVTYWEDFDNIKVYWADGIHSLRSINISEDLDISNSLLTEESLNNVIVSDVKKPEILKIVSGNLKCGLVQYAFQLFNKNGAESTISPLSDIVHLTDSNRNTINYSGNNSTYNSGKTLQLRFNIPDDRFTNIRIYRIQYLEADQLPKINVVSEINLDTTIIDGNIYQSFTDSGISINELSFEEFITSNPYQFIPKVIESKDGRLFAGDIIEDTIDTEEYDFDARAFRFGNNEDLGVHAKVLSNSNADKIITQSDLINMSDIEWNTFLPKTHDCINDYTTNDKSIYRNAISDSGDILEDGGTGRNVSYRIVNTRFGEDFLYKKEPMDRDKFTMDIKDKALLYRAHDYKINRNTALDANSLHINYGMKSAIDLENYDTADGNMSNFDSNFSEFGDRNYSNPILSNKMKSYQRDEIYRFGLVFYNNLGQTSTVKWIGDIRMPSMQEAKWRLFDHNERIITDTGSDVYQIVTFPIGLELKIKNIPEGVTSVELVRCERTRLDRTVLLQGLVSLIGHASGDNARLHPSAFPIMKTNGIYQVNLADDYMDGRPKDEIPYYITGLGAYNKALNFISPEICYFGDQLKDVYSSANKLQFLTGVFSPMQPTGKGLEFAREYYNKYNTSLYFPTLSNVHYDYQPTVSRFEALNDGVIQERGYSLNTRGYLSEYYRGYTSWLSKYYAPFSEYRWHDSEFNSSLGLEQRKVKDLVDIEINSTVFTDSIPFGDFKSAMNHNGYTQSVTGKQYINWASYENYNAETYYGKHGPYTRSLILDCSNYDLYQYSISALGRTLGGEKISNYHGDRNVIATYTKSNEFDLGRAEANASSFICNLKSTIYPYQGADYNSRFQNTYISTSFVFNVDDKQAGGYAFGGDTFIGLNQIVTRHLFFDKENPLPGKSELKDKEGRGGQVTIIYPSESSINTSLTNGSLPWKASNFAKTSQMGAGTFPNGDSQQNNLYAYNSVYSKDNLAKKFIPTQMYTESDKHYDYRVMYSDIKSNDEIADNWLKFKPANYLDLDTRLGAINNLKTYNNSLLFWQDRAFGELPVNQRSLLQNDNEAALLIGTGDVLSPARYLSQANGSLAGSYNNVVATPRALYWYDYNRNELLSYSGDGLDVISKSKGIQSFLNDNTISKRQKFAYDKEFNEVIFTFTTDNEFDNNHNLIYSELIGAFQSFYTYNANWPFTVNGDLYSWSYERLNKHNGVDNLNEYGKFNSDSSIIKYVSNINYPITKKFDNMEFYSETDIADFYVIFDTKNHTTGKLPIKTISEETYKLSIPRAVVKESTGSTLFPIIEERLKGKYLETTLQYIPSLNSKVFKLPYTSTIYRQSNI